MKPPVLAESLRPASVEALQQRCREAASRGTPLPRVDLSALRAVRDYHPEDMTITVEGGLDLESLGKILREHRQWLPLDPARKECVSVERAVGHDAQGPRYCGYGSIREHLIGMEAVMADGRLIHAGGKVVKNVAGFDLHRLWVGSLRQLGILTAATFRLRPCPEQTRVLRLEFDSAAAAMEAIDRLLSLPIEPMVLDLHGGSAFGLARGKCVLVAVFEGDAESVCWQAEQVAPWGMKEVPGLAYDSAFWEPGEAGVVRSAVLPSKLGELIPSAGETAWMARAANGIVFARNPDPEFLRKGAVDRDPMVGGLRERVREAFDPLRLWRMQ